MVHVRRQVHVLKLKNNAKDSCSKQIARQLSYHIFCQGRGYGSTDHHSLLAPTWTASSDYTGRTYSDQQFFIFSYFFIFIFFFILGRAVD